MKFLVRGIIFLITSLMLISCGPQKEPYKAPPPTDPKLIADFNQFFEPTLPLVQDIFKGYGITDLHDDPILNPLGPPQQQGQDQSVMAIAMLYGNRIISGNKVPTVVVLHFSKIKGVWYLMIENDGYVQGFKEKDYPPELHISIKKIFPQQAKTLDLVRDGNLISSSEGSSKH